MRWVAVAAVVCVCVGDARADKIAVPPVHAEADVAAEAAAVTMLVRTALDRGKDTLVDAPPGVGLSSAAKLDVDRIVFVELSREGTGLRATLATAARDGSVDVSFVRAGDGDVVAIATGIAEHLHVPFVPPVGGAALSPFVAAKADPEALVVAQPSVAIAVPAAKQDLVAPDDRVAAIIAARALGDGKALEALATGKDPTAIAAKAFAAMARADIKGAEAALGGKPPKHALIALAQAVIAEHRGDDKKLAEAIKAALESPGPAGRAAVALAASVAPERLPKDLLKLLLDRADKAPPAIASRIGLAAAEQNVEAGRALALVHVHDLDDADLARIERVVAGAASAAIPRLRAELAMRRANGSERKMIDAYLAAAPADPRAKLYDAWQLRHEHEDAKAAAQLDGLDKARALAATGDLRAALAAIDGKTDSPEQQAIAARVAVLDHLDAQASKLVDLAETAAPANPFVQRAVLDVATVKKDDKRIAIARRFKLDDDLHLATGAGATSKDLGSGAKATTTELGKQLSVDLSPDLATLLVGLPGLPQPHRKLALVEQRYKSPLLSLRVANPDVVRAALAAELGKPPMELDVQIDGKPLDDDLTTSSLSARLGDSEAVLIYKVVPTSDGAMVTLTIYQRNATKADEITGPVELPDVSRLDIPKVVVLALVAIIVLGLIGWRVAGGRGHIKIRIEVPPDVTDPVYAVEVTKTPTRPPGTFDHKRLLDMKKAGAIVKARSATLIENGFEMKLPIGKWYVHLMGGFFRGGGLRPVPDMATKEIEVTRGGVHDVVFDLVPAHAELDLVIEAAHGRVSVWLDDDTRNTRYLDGNGKITMPIALGAHVVHVQVGADKHIKRTVHLAVPRIERLAINVARELRIAGEGFRLDTGEPVARIELEDQTFDMAETVAAGPATVAVAADTKLLERYKIVGQLGRGAMGIVHRAWDERLERDVAIKEMAPELLDNADMLDMFVREAKSLAQINHPNIVGIYDQVNTGDKILMIMEFVDGTTLDAAIKKRGKVPWQDAIHVIDQVCAGLAYVHQRKIIHRDIKPANIFIARDRGVKLGDFGLAKVAHETKIRRTETRGTPLYMAPEQVTGKDVDHRADLYAVGCTLFELVCGRPPFIQGEIMWQQVYEAPPAPSTLVNIPASLERVILALIAKSPDERPGTANDVRAAFRKLG